MTIFIKVPLENKRSTTINIDHIVEIQPSANDKLTILILMGQARYDSGTTHAVTVEKPYEEFLDQIQSFCAVHGR